MDSELMVGWIGVVGSLLFMAAAFAWMYFCYFPGGYHRSQVIDIGELALYNAQMRAKSDKYFEKFEHAEGHDDDASYGGQYQAYLDDMFRDQESGPREWTQDGSEVFEESVPEHEGHSWAVEDVAEEESDTSSERVAGSRLHVRE